MQSRHEQHILVVAEIVRQVLKASGMLPERSTGDLLKRKNIRAVFGDVGKWERLTHANSEAHDQSLRLEISGSQTSGIIGITGGLANTECCAHPQSL